MALKVYRVWAECIHDVYVDVVAESEDEAREIADEMDGAEFTEDFTGGEWRLGSAYEIDDEEPTEAMIEAYECWKGEEE